MNKLQKCIGKLLGCTIIEKVIVTKIVNTKGNPLSFHDYLIDEGYAYKKLGSDPYCIYEYTKDRIIVSNYAIALGSPDIEKPYLIEGYVDNFSISTKIEKASDYLYSDFEEAIHKINLAFNALAPLAGQKITNLNSK